MLPVFDEHLAKHLGLSELRVGAERLGPRRAAEALQVLAWWSVSVEPSFTPSWAVGALHEEEWGGGPDPGRVVARGFVADADGAAVAPLAADEVLGALGRLDPFRVEPASRTRVFGSQMWVEMGTLDGLGYALRWETKATEGRLRFANPRAEWLMGFERVLFRFAARVVAASGARRFGEQLRCWARYREPLQDVEQLYGL